MHCQICKWFVLAFTSSKFNSRKTPIPPKYECFLVTIDSCRMSIYKSTGDIFQQLRSGRPVSSYPVATENTLESPYVYLPIGPILWAYQARGAPTLTTIGICVYYTLSSRCTVDEAFIRDADTSINTSRVDILTSFTVWRRNISCSRPSRPTIGSRSCISRLLITYRLQSCLEEVIAQRE
jgi:hypothetical protein